MEPKHQTVRILLVTSVCAFLLMAAMPRPNPSGDESLERTGTVDAWHMLSNGVVSFRLTGRAKDQTFSTWFATPGDKTETTRFEHQALATVLSFAASKQDLTVSYAAKTEKTDKLGRTYKDAIPLEAIMWNVLPSEEKGKEKVPLTTSRKSGG